MKACFTKEAERELFPPEKQIETKTERERQRKITGDRYDDEKKNQSIFLDNRLSFLAQPIQSLLPALPREFRSNRLPAFLVVVIHPITLQEDKYV